MRLFLLVGATLGALGDVNPDFNLCLSTQNEARGYLMSPERKSKILADKSSWCIPSPLDEERTLEDWFGDARETSIMGCEFTDEGLHCYDNPAAFIRSCTGTADKTPTNRGLQLHTSTTDFSYPPQQNRCGVIGRPAGTLADGSAMETYDGFYTEFRGTVLDAKASNTLYLQYYTQTWAGENVTQGASWYNTRLKRQDGTLPSSLADHTYQNVDATLNSGKAANAVSWNEKLVGFNQSSLVRLTKLATSTNTAANFSMKIEWTRVHFFGNNSDTLVYLNCPTVASFCEWDPLDPSTFPTCDSTRNSSGGPGLYCPSGCISPFVNGPDADCTDIQTNIPVDAITDAIGETPGAEQEAKATVAGVDDQRVSGSISNASIPEDGFLSVVLDEDQAAVFDSASPPEWVDDALATVAAALSTPVGDVAAAAVAPEDIRLEVIDVSRYEPDGEGGFRTITGELAPGDYIKISIGPLSSESVRVEVFLLNGTVALAVNGARRTEDPAAVDVVAVCAEYGTTLWTASDGGGAFDLNGGKWNSLTMSREFPICHTSPQLVAIDLSAADGDAANDGDGTRTKKKARKKSKKGKEMSSAKSEGKKAKKGKKGKKGTDMSTVAGAAAGVAVGAAVGLVALRRARSGKSIQQRRTPTVTI